MLSNPLVDYPDSEWNNKCVAKCFGGYDLGNKIGIKAQANKNVDEIVTVEKTSF